MSDAREKVCSSTGSDTSTSYEKESAGSSTPTVTPTLSVDGPLRVALDLADFIPQSSADDQTKYDYLTDHWQPESTFKFPRVERKVKRNEAFVTLATNDLYCKGACVLGQSLRNHGTSRKLIVMISPGVTNTARATLESVFDCVVCVDVLDSKDEAHLALLKRPELGVTFTKLHCWNLTDYNKCVFMDADTLPLTNIDELFEREELSAAPDAGWPDMFNSGVFVYRPSKETFLALIDLAKSRGSFDGGDQGLLNTYFNSWLTSSMEHHLPFVYNMHSTATYTYSPAFARFGKDTKVVHFIGPVKPWHHHYDPTTNILKQTDGKGIHEETFIKTWWRTGCQSESEKGCCAPSSNGDDRGRQAMGETSQVLCGDRNGLGYCLPKVEEALHQFSRFVEEGNQDLPRSLALTSPRTSMEKTVFLESEEVFALNGTKENAGQKKGLKLGKARKGMKKTRKSESLTVKSETRKEEIQDGDGKREAIKAEAIKGESIKMETIKEEETKVEAKNVEKSVEKKNVQERNVEETNVEETNVEEKNVQEKNVQEKNAQEKNAQEINARKENVQEKNAEEINAGKENVGEENVGEENVGEENVEEENVGEENVGEENVGEKNVGEKNVGEKNEGEKNEGEKNEGEKNEGEKYVEMKKNETKKEKTREKETTKAESLSDAVRFELWQRGTTDFLGADSFIKIQARIDKILSVEDKSVSVAHLKDIKSPYNQGGGYKSGAAGKMRRVTKPKALKLADAIIIGNTTIKKSKSPVDFSTRSAGSIEMKPIKLPSSSDQISVESDVLLEIKIPLKAKSSAEKISPNNVGTSIKVTAPIEVEIPMDVTPLQGKLLTGPRSLSEVEKQIEVKVPINIVIDLEDIPNAAKIMTEVEIPIELNALLEIKFPLRIIHIAADYSSKIESSTEINNTKNFVSIL